MMTKSTDGDRTIWNILGFETLKEGLRYFEDEYNKNHRRGYEASMSACINAISFRPSILPLSIKEIEGMAPAMKIVTLHNISGRMTLLPLDPEKANTLWKSGAKPALIEDR